MRNNKREIQNIYFILILRARSISTKIMNGAEKRPIQGRYPIKYIGIEITLLSIVAWLNPKSYWWEAAIKWPKFLLLQTANEISIAREIPATTPKLSKEKSGLCFVAFLLDKNSLTIRVIRITKRSAIALNLIREESPNKIPANANNAIERFSRAE